MTATSTTTDVFDREYTDELNALEQMLQEQHFTTLRHAPDNNLPGLNVAMRPDRSVDVYVRPFKCALPYVLVANDGYWSYQKRSDVVEAMHELLSNSIGWLQH